MNSIKDIVCDKLYAINLVFLGLFFFSMSCNASSWHLLSASDDALFYIDQSTIRADRNIIKVWELIELDKGIGEGQKVKSYKEHREYDCNKEIHRTIYVVHYSGSMGNGNVLRSISTIYDRLDPVVPGSVTETVFNYLCEK